MTCRVRRPSGVEYLTKLPGLLSFPRKALLCSVRSASFFIFIFSALIYGCIQTSGPDGYKYDSWVNGRTLVYPANTKFTLQLEVDADAGRQWDYTISDSNVLRIDSTSYRPASGNWNLVGGETIETFYFSTLRPGSAAVLMIQHQPWAPTTPPVDTLTFTVMVHQ